MNNNIQPGPEKNGTPLNLNSKYSAENQDLVMQRLAKRINRPSWIPKSALRSTQEHTGSPPLVQKHIQTLRWSIARLPKQKTLPDRFSFLRRVYSAPSRLFSRLNLSFLSRKSRLGSDSNASEESPWNMLPNTVFHKPDVQQVLEIPESHNNFDRIPELTVNNIKTPDKPSVKKTPGDYSGTSESFQSGDRPGKPTETQREEGDFKPIARPGKSSLKITPDRLSGFISGPLLNKQKPPSYVEETVARANTAKEKNTLDYRNTVFPGSVKINKDHGPDSIYPVKNAPLSGQSSTSESGKTTESLFQQLSKSVRSGVQGASSEVSLKRDSSEIKVDAHESSIKTRPSGINRADEALKKIKHENPPFNKREPVSNSLIKSHDQFVPSEIKINKLDPAFQQTSPPSSSILEVPRRDGQARVDPVDMVKDTDLSTKPDSSLEPKITKPVGIQSDKEKPDLELGPLPGKPEAGSIDIENTSGSNPVRSAVRENLTINPSPMVPGILKRTKTRPNQPFNMPEIRSTKNRLIPKRTPAQGFELSSTAPAVFKKNAVQFEHPQVAEVTDHSVSKGISSKTAPIEMKTDAEHPINPQTIKVAGESVSNGISSKTAPIETRADAGHPKNPQITKVAGESVSNGISSKTAPIEMRADAEHPINPQTTEIMHESVSNGISSKTAPIEMKTDAGHLINPQTTEVAGETISAGISSKIAPIEMKTDAGHLINPQTTEIAHESVSNGISFKTAPIETKADAGHPINPQITEVADESVSDGISLKTAPIEMKTDAGHLINPQTTEVADESVSDGISFKTAPVGFKTKGVQLEHPQAADIVYKTASGEIFLKEGKTDQTRPESLYKQVQTQTPYLEVTNRQFSHTSQKTSPEVSSERLKMSPEPSRSPYKAGPSLLPSLTHFASHTEPGIQDNTIDRSAAPVDGQDMAAQNKLENNSIASGSFLGAAEVGFTPVIENASQTPQSGIINRKKESALTHRDQRQIDNDALGHVLGQTIVKPRLASLISGMGISSPVSVFPPLEQVVRSVQTDRGKGYGNEVALDLPVVPVMRMEHSLSKSVSADNLLRKQESASGNLPESSFKEINPAFRSPERKISREIDEQSVFNTRTDEDRPESARVPDLRLIAEKVYSLLKQELKIERERARQNNLR